VRPFTGQTLEDEQRAFKTKPDFVKKPLQPKASEVHSLKAKPKIKAPQIGKSVALRNPSRGVTKLKKAQLPEDLEGADFKGSFTTGRSGDPSSGSVATHEVDSQNFSVQKTAHMISGVYKPRQSSNQSCESGQR